MTWQEPKSSRLATTRSPAPSKAPRAVKTAAMPVAVANAAGAPSRADMRCSNMRTVGLPNREYMNRSISSAKACAASSADP